MNENNFPTRTISSAVSLNRPSTPTNTPCKENVGLIQGAETFCPETNALLKKRLQASTLIFTIGTILFYVRGFFTQDQPLNFQLVLLVVLLVSLAILYSSACLSMRALRTLEGVVFSSLAFLLGIKYSTVIWNAAALGNEAIALTNINHLGFAFFAMIVVYGLFIPNTWKRTFVVVLSLAMFPIMSFAFIYSHYEIVRHTETWSLTLFFVFFGMVISVYGSHIMHTLRQEAKKAREIGQYRLKEKIGSGGMGEVWKAQHRMLVRPAAIKLIRQEVIQKEDDSAQTALRRFEREAKATSRLQCPHTIQIYDFGQTQDNSFYYVMEYLEGLDLDTLVAKFGPISPARTVHLLKQVCLSLAEAHFRGMVHRDIKPANIYTCQMGLQYDFVKVLDFGLVKQRSWKEEENGKPELKLTKMGVVTGTPAFIAPEMILQNNEIDRRADIYALGCVAYWLLTGLFVFAKESAMATLLAHLNDEPIPPSEVAGQEIPPALDEIVMSCLSKKPQDRPSSAMDVYRSFCSCSLGEDIWNEESAARWWVKYTK